MARSQKSEGYSSMDDDMAGDAATVQLFDETGRSLLCYIERTLEVEDREYLLLMPVDSPIEVFAWEADEDDEDEESLVDIEEEEIDEIFDTARAVLAEHDLTLNRTALTLTASGDLPEAPEEDIITLDISDDDENFSSEDFQLLANFYHEEQEYAICTPLEPLLFFARVNSGGKPELLSPEEFQMVRSQLEDQLFDELDPEH
jgi:Protein of unknown function (DUF3727)/Protein of unknown function (DUF1292)